MNHSSDTYKVVNAVVNALSKRKDRRIFYVDSQDGAGAFSNDDDKERLRDNLLQYPYCEEVSGEDVAHGFPPETNGCDIWRLYMGEKTDAWIQIAIDFCDYVHSSYELRDLMEWELGLKSAEITCARSGYPRGLHGCLLVDSDKFSFEELKTIGERWGVELVKLRRKDGSDLWINDGRAFDLFDYEQFLQEHDNDVMIFDSWYEYAEVLRERAEEMDDEDDAKELRDMADNAEDGDELSKDRFIKVSCYDIKDYSIEDCKVCQFAFDSWYYSLGFDCDSE